MATKPTPAKPPKFVQAIRWAFVIGAELFEMYRTEKEARDIARCMYPGKQAYVNAIRKKEIDIFKAVVRRAQPVKK